MARSSRGPSPRTTVSREAFRVLRSNLGLLLRDLERPTVLVTSAREGEGKTSTCAGLARSFALSGSRVIGIDLDLRHANLHRALGGHNEFGVTDVLLEHRRLEECLQHIEIGQSTRRRGRSLYLLSAGGAVSNPTEVLHSGRTPKLLDSLARQADVVLIDTPPVLPVADTLVIGRMVAGALLVVESRQTAWPQVQRAKDSLTRNQTRLLGIVLNKVPAREAEYGYGYGYGRDHRQPTLDE